MREKTWLFGIGHEEDTKSGELAVIKKYNHSSLLDMGCGNGEVLSMLEGRKMGIDNDDEALTICKERGLNVQKVDLNKPFDLHKRFDTIISLQVFEHLVYPEVAVKSVYNHLKKGGIFIISVPYHGLIKNLVIALFDFNSHYHYTDWHLRFFTPTTLKELVKEFKLIDFKKVGRWYPMNKSMIAVCKKLN